MAYDLYKLTFSGNSRMLLSRPIVGYQTEPILHRISLSLISKVNLETSMYKTTSACAESLCRMCFTEKKGFNILRCLVCSSPVCVCALGVTPG